MLIKGKNSLGKLKKLTFNYYGNTHFYMLAYYKDILTQNKYFTNT